MAISVGTAQRADAAELAGVAAATFPLACPASSGPQDIAAFIAGNLSAGCFDGYLSDPRRRVLAARDDGRIVGYAMLVSGIGDDPDIDRAVFARPAVELSKMYLLADFHRTGAAAALMRAGLAWAADVGARAVWLGVNRANERAQRFYRKHGFDIAGARTFRLGYALEEDFVMVRPIPG